MTTKDKGKTNKGKLSEHAHTPSRVEVLERFGTWLQDKRLTMRSPETGDPVTQTEAARMIGMSRPNYNEIERGATGLSYEMVERIADGLGLDATEALIRAGFNPGIMENIPLAFLELQNLPQEAQIMIMKQIEAYKEVFGQQENPTPSKRK